MIEVQRISAIENPPWDKFHQGILPHFDQYVQRYYMRLPCVVRPLALTGLPLYPILFFHNALGPYGLANDNML